VTTPSGLTPESPKPAILAGKKVQGPNGIVTTDPYLITFSFNPNTITMSHGSPPKESGAGDGSTIVTTREELGLPNLKLADVTFDGANVLDDCEQLMWWSYSLPPPGDPDGTKNVPQLKFSWGSFQARGATPILVTITRVDITYERFSPGGTPIRATVKLDLKPESSSAATTSQQNPTSGGLPGRGGHLLTSGETLPGIALDTYGDPASWRPVAEANQLDDPLRVRPGALLYLPSRAELAGGDAA